MVFDPQSDYIWLELSQLKTQAFSIQLKYLPKVEKKNAQDKTSQGKLSRQIANLKQTLKHTTESSIQLDSTIEQKIKELEQVNDEIEKASNEIQGIEEESNNQLMEVVGLKIDRQNNLRRIFVNQTQGKRFDEILDGRFRGSVEEDRVDKALEDQIVHNQKIQEIIGKVMSENQYLEPVLGRLLAWDNDQ